jgi:three-Cys-motif partner protein
MGHQALKVEAEPKLLLVDGFAGPGEYQGGESGSPQIMLDALIEHAGRDRLAGVAFYYLFIERDPRRVDHLREVISRRRLPKNVEVEIEQGEFETSFGTLVDEIQAKSEQLIPTFAFIDPFGYSKASMSLNGRFLDFHRSEALIFLPLSFICRFVGRQGQENALNSLFASDEWRAAIRLQGDDRAGFLLSLFERQLRSQRNVRHVWSFELHTDDGQDYRLVFATGHPRGLELMKEAMWSVDPYEGARYVAHNETGQEVLFGPEPNTRPLLDALRQVYGERWFTIDEAERTTLEQTAFLPRRHLKKLTLKAAEAAGVLEVERRDGKARGTFSDGTRMRFVAAAPPER